MSVLESAKQGQAAQSGLEDYSGLSLDELGPKIRDLHQQATSFAGLARQVAFQSLESALAAGSALLAAKTKVAHGDWKTWRTTNVPALSEDQACRYMRLAKEIPHVRNMDALKTVRQAYLATGVIKEPAKKKESAGDGLDKKTALAPSDFVSRFQSMRGFLETALPRLEFAKLPAAERDEMEAQLREILAVLQNTLSKIKEILPAENPASVKIKS